MFPDFLENPSDVAAPLLLGCTLTRTITLNGEKHKLVASRIILMRFKTMTYTMPCAYTAICQKPGSAMTGGRVLCVLFW